MKFDIEKLRLTEKEIEPFRNIGDYYVEGLIEDEDELLNAQIRKVISELGLAYSELRIELEV